MNRSGRKVSGRKPVSGSDERTRILEALRKAGSGGLSRSRLGPARKREIDRILEALLLEGRIVRLGPLSQALYFPAGSAPTPAAAAEAIDRGAAQYPARLFLGKELARFCPRAQRFFCEEAIEQLVREGVLLRLTRGKSLYYTHREGCAPGVARDGEPRFDPKKVREAYAVLVHTRGFLDVQIAALASEARVPLADLHAWLKEESAAGRAHLSRGDWSLSTEEERKAAILLDGEPHLRVRIDSQAAGASR